MIPLVNLKQQYKYLKPEIDKAMSDVFLSGKFISGENVQILEQKIAKYVGVKYAISCASGTDALILALTACGIKPQDKVITTAFSFFATAEAIARVGAIPVFVDIDEDTYNINVDRIEEKISKKTKAILLVHLFGQPVEMDGLIKVARKYKLKVIEDACQAIGAKYKGKMVGSFGDVGCFSFFPTKNLGAYGDGGLLTTNDYKLSAVLRGLKEHGGGKAGYEAYRTLHRKKSQKSKVTKYHNYLIGYNSRLDEVQAGILLVKLKYLNRWNKLREKNARYYSEKFKDIEPQTPKIIENSQCVFNQYSMRYNRRDKIVSYLKQKQIEVGIYYPVPLHLQKAFTYLGHKKGDMPIAESVSEKIFSIPVNPELEEKEKKYIVDEILNFIKN